jgi:hypothetical protein
MDRGRYHAPAAREFVDIHQCREILPRRVRRNGAPGGLKLTWSAHAPPIRHFFNEIRDRPHPPGSGRPARYVPVRGLLHEPTVADDERLAG